MSKDKTFQQIMDDEGAHKEIPKPGQKWIETYRVKDNLAHQHHRFLIALTGKAYTLYKMYCTYDEAPAFTEEIVNGKPAMFMWGEEKREYTNADHEEITIKLPKAIAAKIKTQGADINGKVQKDVMELYAQL